MHTNIALADNNNSNSNSGYTNYNSGNSSSNFCNTTPSSVNITSNVIHSMVFSLPRYSQPIIPKPPSVSANYTFTPPPIVNNPFPFHTAIERDGMSFLNPINTPLIQNRSLLSTNTNTFTSPTNIPSLSSNTNISESNYTDTSANKNLLSERVIEEIKPSYDLYIEDKISEEKLR